MAYMLAKLPAKNSATVEVLGQNVARMDCRGCSDEENENFTYFVASELFRIAMQTLDCPFADALQRLPVAEPVGFVGPTPARIEGWTESGLTSLDPGVACCMARAPDNRLFIYYATGRPTYVKACGKFDKI
jgi:hypothetical protein